MTSLQANKAELDLALKLKKAPVSDCAGLAKSRTGDLSELLSASQEKVDNVLSRLNTDAPSLEKHLADFFGESVSDNQRESHAGDEEVTISITVKGGKVFVN